LLTRFRLVAGGCACRFATAAAVAVHGGGGGGGGNNHVVVAAVVVVVAVVVVGDGDDKDLAAATTAARVTAYSADLLADAKASSGVRKETFPVAFPVAFPAAFPAAFPELREEDLTRLTAKLALPSSAPSTLLRLPPLTAPRPCRWPPPGPPAPPEEEAITAA